VVLDHVVSLFYTLFLPDNREACIARHASCAARHGELGMRKIYIAGCGGMLGEAFYNVFKGDFTLKCTDKDVNEEWLSFLDFRDFDKYREDVVSFSPDYLFHLGALTDLEYCELHEDDAYMTNALSVEHAVIIASELDVPILYIGTGGIFDGHKEAYDDWDVPSPLGAYARAKCAGERYVMERARRYFICRAGWMMGGGPAKDKKFVNKIMKQLKEGRKELFIVNDKLGTPTYTYDFAHNVKLLLETEFWGLYNVACSGMTSRLEVAKEMLSILHLGDEVKITEVSSDYYKDEYFAERPRSERLLNRKLDLRGLNIMRDWKTGLREYLEKSFRDYIEWGKK
jgi:dTDP-4-dehydrorhamnose reductase